jgi:hypothetical protein
MESERVRFRNRSLPEGQKLLEFSFQTGEIPRMTTVTVDDRKRVRIPDAKPGQVFALENKADGSVMLIPFKVPSKERFPRGSRKKFITPQNNREMLQLLKGCAQGPVE